MRKIVVGVIFFFCLAPHAYAATIDRPMNNLGMLGYWPLDGATTNWSSGTTQDVSGNSVTGTLKSMSTSTQPVIGKVGQALRFSTPGQYVDLGTGLNPGAITYAAWVKADTWSNSSGYNGIVVRNSGVSNLFAAMMVKSTGKLAFYAGNGTATDYDGTGANTLSAGTWYFLVFTYDSTNGLVGYVNGTVDGTASTVGALTSTAITTAIGTDPSLSTTRNFNGTIDDVRIYNRALSATEVKALYAAESTHLGTGSNSLKTNLVAYWKFDNSTTDATGNGWNGTLVNGPSYAAGEINNGILLNGTNQYVTTAYTGQLTDFTVCAWFNTGASVNSTSYDRIVDKNYAAGFWLGRSAATNNWGGGVEQSSAPYGIFVTLPQNTWNFICEERQGTTQTINANGGALTNSQTVSSAALDTSALHIGSTIVPDGEFHGTIDEVGLWSRALSSSEIAALYNSTKGKQYPFVPQTTIGHSNAASGGSGLVGYWTMDGSKTNWATGQETDASGNGNTASLISMSTTTQPTQGKIGQALKFDGSSQYLSLPTLTQTSAGTVSMWINPGSTISSSKNVGIFDAGTPNTGEMLMRWSDGTGQMYFYVDSGTYKSVATNTATWTAGQWYLVTGTWDGSNIKIYVNGVLENTTAQGSPTLGTGGWRIGASSSGATVYYWNGGIDDARIYSRALSASEISALYNAGR